MKTGLDHVPAGKRRELEHVRASPLSSPANPTKPPRKTALKPRSSITPI